MSSVSAGVSALVVGVYAKVEAHELVEAWVVVPEHPAKVSAVVEGGILGNLPVKVYVAVDLGRDFGQLSHDIQDVLEDVAVVVRLWHSVLVGLGELGGSLSSAQADCELGHGVHVLGKGVKERHDVAGQGVGALVKVGGERVDLRLGRNLARHEQPQKTLQQGLSVGRTSGPLEGGKDVLALRDGVTPKPDALLRVEVGRFPQHALDAPGASDALVHRHLPQHLVPMLLLEGKEGGLLLGNLSGQNFLQGRHGATVPDGSGLRARDGERERSER